MITSPSPCYSQASRPRGSLQNLSIDSFIAELINPPAHHNSGNASTKPLQHLVGIEDLKYREVTHTASVSPVLSRIARDILAIPGVSISVEWLFSSSKHTLSDSRSLMTAESASKTVVAKEWLKKGLGDGLNYLDEVHILE
ncbi:hypothetical protein PILCRDRAFT_12545 [Piloderma croceum F 1598]|uniref:HAT C-terminal dimerisation domain-containing protein n=1 Tax=Piloderma croceum (strain F 1598) TaxID=765440 RepID=A0A0C3ARW7_PILCF|nr:hypothetical protein PILCRDRAFT_12545 [Piloderma croceum F 1598]